MLKSLFQVVSISTNSKSNGVRVLLVAVPTESHELQNINLFDAATNSSMELIVNDADRAQFFESGKRYEVTFEAK